MSLIQLRRAANVLGLDSLPSLLPVDDIAILQTHDDPIPDNLTRTQTNMRRMGRAGLWCDTMIADIQAGGLPHTTTTERKMVSPARDVEPSQFGFGDHPAWATRDGVRYAYTVPAVYKDFTTHHIAAQDFAQWLAAQGEQPSRLVAAWFKSQGVGEVATPQPAPASEPQSNTVTMKRKALIDELRPQWPTIEADLSEASRNGLSAASVGNGMWDRDEALAWAKSRGKLKTSNVHALPGAWPSGVTRHQWKG
jgi:hypothetical protein